MHSDVNPPGPAGLAKRVKPAVQAFQSSPVAWRLDQAIFHLNANLPEGEVHYWFLIDMLRESGAELLATVKSVFERSSDADATLRWNLLYILGDVAATETADFLVDVAALDYAAGADRESIAANDLELLVAAEAVHALRRIGAHHPRVLVSLWRLVKRRPPRPILIEIAQIAAQLGKRRALKEVLAEEDQALLYMRRTKAAEQSPRHCL